MKNYKNKKSTFLSKLKNSPYSDKLIDMWMETFKDDFICLQFIKAIDLTNSQWKKFENNGISIEEFVDAIYTSYTNAQDISHNLGITVLIGSCDEISNQFIVSQLIKNITIIRK